VTVTRFAPSPTGRLHLGHAYSAVLGHGRARDSGGSFRLRIEDLDPTRSRPEFVAGIAEDLDWLGLAPDAPVLVQSQRTPAYEAALEQLKRQGLAYACFCTRADIAQSLTAPHGDAATSYPGTCRDLPDDPERRAATPHCWRLDSATYRNMLISPRIQGYRKHPILHAEWQFIDVAKAPGSVSSGAPSKAAPD